MEGCSVGVVGVKGASIRSNCLSSNRRRGAAGFPFKTSLSKTQSRFSHQDSFGMSAGAIARIKYRIKAEEEASSTWNGRNASSANNC